MNPTLSVITPVMNAAHLIDDHIGSVHIALDGINYEHIIVEGGSTDNTIQAVQEYSWDSHIRLIGAGVKAIMPKCNLGVREAKGEWLYFIGADDRMIPGNHEAIREMLNTDKDIVYGDIFSVRHLENCNGAFDELRIMKQNISQGNLFIRKRVFERLGQWFIPKYTICADYELNLRLFLDKSIKKQYHRVTLAVISDGGISTRKRDVCFENDFYRIVSSALAKSGGPVRRLYLRTRLIIKVLNRLFKQDPQHYNETNQHFI